MTFDRILDSADRYLGPIGAWIAQAVAWAFAGMNLITALGALAALWWTIERARTERAKRRLETMKADEFADYVQGHHGTLRRLVDHLRTKPSDLKD